MKKLIMFLFCSLVASSFGQSERVYGPWQTVYQETVGEKSVKVEISFSFWECNSNNVMIGASHYRIRNSFSSSRKITFTFEYLTCENQKQIKRVVFDLNSPGIIEGTGDAFYGKSVSKLELIKITAETSETTKLNDNDKVIIESVPEKTVVVIDGHRADVEPIKKKMTQEELNSTLGRTRIKSFPSDSAKDKIKGTKANNGTRGEIQKPQVESIAITEEVADPKKKKAATKKK